MKNSGSATLIEVLSQYPPVEALLSLPNWWNSLNRVQKFAPLLSVLAYWGWLYFVKGLHGDQTFFGVCILALSYSGRGGRSLLRFFLPFLLTIMVYDSQRHYSDYLRGPVHVSEPYFFDKKFFGISTSQGLLTPNEWLQLHTHPILDIISGMAYLNFITIYLLISAYISFYVVRTGTRKYKASQLKNEIYRMPWAFFFLNILGYSTYYWYAAAPPWYVSLFGLGPARMDTPANPAGCLRFDEILGTHVFAEMYGRSADVFGAIPSLHVAYPLLAVYFAFRFGAARSVSLIAYGVMCFSAVYLNHHYILDILWGSSYAILIGWLTNRICDLKNTNRLKTSLSLNGAA